MHRKNLLNLNIGALVLLLLAAPAALAAPSASFLNGPPQPITQVGDRTSAKSAHTVALAENGRALVPIVIANNASENVRASAKYLAEKLQKITGAPFEITNGDGNSGIVLATFDQLPIAELKKSLEIRPIAPTTDIKNGVEAYAIRTEPKRILLLGGGEPGISHAVSRLLEIVGYRQFYPAPEWEIAPSIPALKFGWNETDRPAILARHLWYAFGVPAEPTTSDAPPEARSIRSKTDLPAWYRQNRLGESFRVYAAHNYANIITNNKEAFAAHPEYRILLNGQRSERGICTSHPAVRAMATKLALDYFEKYPDRDMYSMERGDGNIMCECDLCKAVGNDSNRVFGFANEVAKAVRARYPGKQIGVLAYNLHDMPPDFEMEPNVHVQVARLFIQSGKTFRELVDLWSNKTNNLGVYDYFSTFQWGQDRLRARGSAGPTGDLALLRSDISFLKRNGVLSLWSESSVAWGAHGRGNLVATRLMWNPEADVDAVLQDFYDKAFGPAAPAMKRYFERVDGENELFSRTLLGLAFRDVDEAAKLAKDRPNVLARIDHIKQFLIYNYLNARVFETKGDENKKWFLAMMTHEFRTRYSYMTHWHARTNFLADYAKRYNEPSWAMPNWKEVAAARKAGQPVPTAPWQVEPYTREETEAAFQEGLAYFQPQTVLPRVTYSKDLVPVAWANTPAAPASRQIVSATTPIYLYSLTGEPLEIELKVGKSGEKSPYTLHDQHGKVVGKGELTEDDGSHALKLDVPAAGLYSFQFRGRGPVNYAVPASRANTLLLTEGQAEVRYTLQGAGGRNFFYVPKGTKQVQYYWNGTPHNVYDGDGKLIQAVTQSMDYVTIPVPQGADGTLWSFNQRFDTRQFINIPNAIAPSPDALMLPRELVAKDGLTIRHVQPQ